MVDGQDAAAQELARDERHARDQARVPRAHEGPALSLAELEVELVVPGLPARLVLAARDGLEVGADDYITKPFAPKELIARMKAILRRATNEDAGSELRVGELVLDIDSRRVTVGAKALEMGPTEFKLLHFFMSHPERAYSRSQLLDRVWGANVYVEERTVDVHIRRLRKALQAGDPIYADLIQTVRGTGYRFSPRDLAAV